MAQLRSLYSKQGKSGVKLKKELSLTRNQMNLPCQSTRSLFYLYVELLETPEKKKEERRKKKKNIHLSKSYLTPIQVLLTLLYVVPFYLSPTTRPSPSLSRDAPSVIRARIRAVTGSCIVSSVLVLWLIVEGDNSSLGAGVRLLGWWPVGLLETLRSLLLTAILFLGPLFERGIVEGEWKFWFRRSSLSECLGGWIGWRNYVAVSTSFFLFFPFFSFLCFFFSVPFFLYQKANLISLRAPLPKKSCSDPRWSRYIC